MKKNFIFATISIFFITNLFCQNINNNFNIHEYILENDLQVFIAEDFSSVPVKIELSVKAGFSCQTQDTLGFFSLYSALFEHSASKEYKDIIFSKNNYSFQTNADSSRYITTVSPSYLKTALSQLYKCAFFPSFSNKELKEELSKAKTQVMQYANSPAGFINSSIDAKIFSNAPWKHDSGIYPSIFNATTPNKARTILNKIAKDYYTADKCALFICGPVDVNETIKIIEEIFSSASKGTNFSIEQKDVIQEAKEKYLIHSSDLSEDFTQIVIQYTTLNMTQADILATAFNLHNSSIKMALLNEKKLNISDEEYINFSAVHKNGTSRIIFQTLLEKQKNALPITEQINILENIIKNAANIITEEEIITAKQILISDFDKVCKDYKTFTDYLAQYWAIKDLLPQNKTLSSLCESFFYRKEQINNENIENIFNNYKNENPYIFALVNSKIYKNNKTKIAKEKYKIIDTKNGSWYTQNLYKNAKQDLIKEETINNLKDSTLNDFYTFYENNNLSSFVSFKLKNQIPVTLKNNKNTSDVTILLSIKGGKLNDNLNQGASSVMTASFAYNIQKEIFKKQKEGLIKSIPDISSATEFDYTYILIESNYNDLNQIINAISLALIYGDIYASQADSIVYSVKTEKRLYNASPINQMSSKALDYIYSDITLSKIFNSNDDILLNTKYTDILASYPSFLDASLYNIVITGNINQEELKETLESSLGVLYSPKKEEYKKQKIQIVNKPKTITTKINHLFYTDIKAEDAGPMPAILVPTKEFLDPVQFWVKSPETEGERTLFNAIAIYLAEQLEQTQSELYSEIKLNLQNEYITFATFNFLDVKKTKPIEQIYKNAIEDLLKSIENDESKEEALLKIKNSWILNTLSDTQTNKGLAMLINKGININKNPKKYIEDYSLIVKATEEDFINIINNYFMKDIYLKVYSADSTK